MSIAPRRGRAPPTPQTPTTPTMEHLVAAADRIGAAAHDRATVESVINVVFLLSPIIFIALQKVTAPFGRHAIGVRRWCAAKTGERRDSARRRPAIEAQRPGKRTAPCAAGPAGRSLDAPGSIWRRPTAGRLTQSCRASSERACPQTTESKYFGFKINARLAWLYGPGRAWRRRSPEPRSQTRPRDVATRCARVASQPAGAAGVLASASHLVPLWRPGRDEPPREQGARRHVCLALL